MSKSKISLDETGALVEFGVIVGVNVFTSGAIEFASDRPI